MPTIVQGLFKSQMGLSLLPSTSVRPTFHPNSLNVIKAFRFAMLLTFSYVKIHCGATGCEACHFSLSQQKRKRYQIVGQYVANNYAHRTAQITMSQLLRLKKKNYFNNSRIPLLGVSSVIPCTFPASSVLCE